MLDVIIGSLLSKKWEDRGGMQGKYKDQEWGEMIDAFIEEEKILQSKKMRKVIEE